MSNPSWMIRTEESKPNEVYEHYPTLITVRINHGGVFIAFPGQRYINGKHDYVDLVNTDELSIFDFDAIMIELEYNEEEQMFYYFLIPNNELDFGLQTLRSDQNILNLLKYAPKIKLIDIFVEHGKKNFYTYLEENKKEDATSVTEKFLLEWVDTKAEGSNAYEPVEETHLPKTGKIDEFDPFDDFDPFDGLENHLPEVDEESGIQHYVDHNNDSEAVIGDYIDSNAEWMRVDEETSDCHKMVM